MYQFRAISIPGDANGGANAMSRIPTHTTKVAAAELDSMEEALQAGIESRYNQETSPIKMVRIQQEAAMDHQYMNLVETIEQGFPEHKDLLQPNIKEFWNMRSDLYTVQSLVFKEGRILIPKNLHRELIDQLHVGHQGVNSMRSNARQRFFEHNCRKSAISASAVTKLPHQTIKNLQWSLSTQNTLSSRQ